ncbi:hypothetical protein [Mycoplasma sp. B6400]|uniref:hypothetical protein n=1 Tax=Mycoplasma sp. B6400 TaxID=3401674 RepID=UPI003AAFF5E2
MNWTIHDANRKLAWWMKKHVSTNEDNLEELIQEFNANFKAMDWNQFLWFIFLDIKLDNRQESQETISRAIDITAEYLATKKQDATPAKEWWTESIKTENEDEYNALAVSALYWIYNATWGSDEFLKFILTKCTIKVIY